MELKSLEKPSPYAVAQESFARRTRSLMSMRADEESEEIADVEVLRLYARVRLRNRLCGADWQVGEPMPPASPGSPAKGAWQQALRGMKLRADLAAVGGVGPSTHPSVSSPISPDVKGLRGSPLKRSLDGTQRNFS